MDAELSAGHFAGVVNVLSDARAYGIPEAELVPYRELLAEARLKGFKEQALLPKGLDSSL